MGTAGSSLLLLQAALVGELALPGSVFPVGTNVLETRCILLPAVLAIMAHLNASLALQWPAHASMDILRGSARQGSAGRGEGSFLAMTTEDSRVISLAAFIGVGGVRVAGGGGARRMRLDVEFGALVCLIDLAAGLVLLAMLATSH